MSTSDIVVGERIDALHDRPDGDRLIGSARPSAGWSALAQRGGADSRIVIGDRLAAMIGMVSSTTIGRHDRARPIAAEGGRGVERVDELLADGLTSLTLTDHPVDDVVGVIASVQRGALDIDGAADKAHHGHAGAATVTVLVAEEESVSIVHVGDASAFRIRHGHATELTPLTQPHTVAAELRAAGRHPNSRAEAVVTRLVGDGAWLEGDLVVDVTTVPISAGRACYLVIEHTSMAHPDLLRLAALNQSAHGLIDAVCPLLSAGTAAFAVEVSA